MGNNKVSKHNNYNFPILEVANKLEEDYNVLKRDRIQSNNIQSISVTLLIINKILQEEYDINEGGNDSKQSNWGESK